MSARSNSRKDVLIADGIDFYRRMLAELLRGQGYGVSEVETAEEALRHIESDRPDLVVLDLNLPPAGGRALLEGARAALGRPPRTIALAHTFHDDAEVERLRALGVAACVTRSAPVDDILVAARMALFPEAKDLRRSPRAQVHIPVSYRTDESDGGPGVELATHSFNLSADGMFLVATNVAPPPPGSRVRVRFWLPASPRVIESDGVVIWCNQAGGRLNELYPPGMGVMFLGLGRDEAAVVNEYVRERTVNPFR